MGMPNKKRKLVLTKTLTRILVSYFVIILISVSLISVVLYYRFSAATIEDIQMNIQDRLAQNMNQIKMIRDQESALGLQLINDSDIIDVIYRDTTDELSRFKASRKLKQVCDSTPMISSIYVYNSKTGQFISDYGPSSPLALETELKSLPQQNPKDAQLKFIPLNYTYMNASGDMAQENILTSVFTGSAQAYSENPDAKENSLDCSVIINLKAEYVQKTIATMDNSSNSEMYLLNNAGDVVCDSDFMHYGKNLSDVGYIADILKGNAKSGYRIENENSDRFLVSYYRPDGMPFIIVNRSDYTTLLSKVYDLRQTIITVCILIFLLCIVLSVLAAYNVNLPFGALVNSVKWQLPNTDDGKSTYNEIEYLSKAFTKIISQSNEQEMFIRENKPILKNTFLRGLLDGEIELSSDVSNKLKEMKFNVGVGRTCVILFSIDGFLKLSGFKSHITRCSVKAGMESIIAAELSPGLEMEIVDIEGDSIATLVTVEDEEAFNEEIIGKLNAVRDSIGEKLGISVSAAVGLSVDKLESLHLSYDNCLQLLKYRFVYGYGSILDNSLINATINKRYTSVEENKKKIIQAIKACDSGQLEKEMNDIVMLITDSQYDYIRLTINQLALDIMKAVEPLIATENEESDFNNTYSSLNTIDTLEEVKDWFILYCNDIIHMLDGKNDNRKKDMITLALSYIDANYLNPEISAGMLSDIVNLTYGYFGKLFNDYVGMSVNEYITQLRMKKAKEMLENDSIPVNNITMKVGFSNQSYFAAIFKKYYGVRPNQYRLNFKKAKGCTG